ncbi:MAG: hypothetical protein JWP06_524 [Candidatus Saccharibacteria bacterium]|nr:hypothetical protein [Candidatus Saccharibacteria bacterium]
MEDVMGFIGPGDRYAENSVIFLVALDRNVSSVRQADDIRKQMETPDPRAPRLAPLSFVFMANRPGETTVTFSRSLSDRELRHALRLMAEKLVRLHFFDSMPALPDPVRSR